VILRSGYFLDFVGSPKIVIWGESDGMYQLAELLRANASRIGAPALDSLVRSVDDRPIVLRAVSKPRGMIVSGSGFEWHLDSDTMTTFAEMIDPLAVANSPGHQFLECRVSEEICVLVSCGEYPANLHPDRHAKTRC
jgi:hypothetical protein